MKKSKKEEKYQKFKDSANGLDIFNKEKKSFNSLGMGVHNDVFYYGTSVEIDGQEYSCLITSDKKFYVGYSDRNEIKQKFGLGYNTNFQEDDLDFKWPNQSIKKYLSKDYTKKSIKHLYSALLEKNKEYLDHLDERTQSFIVCDIMSQYAYRLFRTKGRTYLKGDKGCGKTKQSRICWLSGFNTIWISGISGAALFRTIERTSGTPIIDNFDNLSDELKTDITQLMETGWEEQAKIRRCGGKTNQRIDKFHIYSSLVLNNIVGIGHVTQDRCFTIVMLKTTSAKGKKQPRKENPFWAIFRDDMRNFVLDNWKDIKKSYEELEVPEFNDRLLEVVAPVLTIAKLVGNKEYEELIKYVKENDEKIKNRDYTTDFRYIVYSEMLKVLGDKTSCALPTSALAEAVIPLFRGVSKPSGEENNYSYLKKDWEQEMRSTAIKIGRSLSNTPLRVFGSGGRMKIDVRKDVVLRLMLSQNYLSEEEKQKYMSIISRPLSTLSTSSTLSTQSTLSTKKIKKIKKSDLTHKKVEGVESVEGSADMKGGGNG